MPADGPQEGLKRRIFGTSGKELLYSVALHLIILDRILCRRHF